MQLQFKSSSHIQLLYKNDSVNLIERKKPKGGRKKGKLKELECKCLKLPLPLMHLT